MNLRMYLTAKYQKINGHIYWPLSRKQKFDQLAIKSKKWLIECCKIKKKLQCTSKTTMCILEI